MGVLIEITSVVFWDFTTDGQQQTNWYIYVHPFIPVPK